MATMQVNIANIKGNVADFPVGYVEASVNSAKLDVSKKGDPMIVMELELYHPDHGTAIMRDYLPSTFPSKVKAFYQAFNRMSKEELQKVEFINIDADDLVGGTLIIYLGEKEGLDGNLYKSIENPWYLPDTRIDVLAYSDSDHPF